MTEIGLKLEKFYCLSSQNLLMIIILRQHIYHIEKNNHEFSFEILMPKEILLISLFSI